jgi:hypothetical protein
MKSEIRNQKKNWGVFSCLLISNFIFLLCSCAKAQYLGNVSPQSLQQTLAVAGTACTGAAQTFVVENVGQTQHYASIVTTGISTLQMEIDGLDNKGNIYRISDVNESAGTGARASMVTGSGYFPTVQVVLTCSPGTGTFQLSYSGSSATSNVNTGVFLFSQLNKVSFTNLTGASNQVDSFETPFGSSAGIMLFQYRASAIAGSTIIWSCLSPLLLQQSTTTFTIANTLNLQTFTPPTGPCATMKINYVSGGAAGAFDEEYDFNPPGTLLNSSSASSLSASMDNGAALAEKGPRWSVVSGPAVSLQATASKAAGAAGVRHVCDCVTVSAGASTAPAAATELTINLRDGASGAGTVIWSTEITAAATAANHGNVPLCGLNLIGTAATAMTLEFGALLTNEFESVTLTGYDVQ